MCEEVASSSSSIAAMLRATAEEAVSQTGFVFDESSGMYYDHSTGFYYDSVCCPHTTMTIPNSLSYSLSLTLFIYLFIYIVALEKNSD